MSEVVFLNGRIVPAGEAKVSAFDAGLTHAAGLFETLRAYNGHIMRLNEHVRRLLHSAEALQMQLAITGDELAGALINVLESNKLREARLRLVVTPGEVPRPGAEESGTPTPTVLASATEVRPYPPEQYRTGWRVCISPYKASRFDPLAGHKTLAYLPRLMALRDAAARRCNESLWFNTENQLSEGSICNVFIVVEGGIVTPPIDTPLLAGMTRQCVIEQCAANGIRLEERAIDINMLLAAQEVFLTGSVLEVMPVTAIEKHVVGGGMPGPTTKRVMELYRELVRQECGV